VTARTPLLAARGAGRRYGKTAALDPVELEIWDGEALALVGPNGAGKSTLLSLLAGALEPSDGRVERRKGVRVGWAPQRPAQYGRLSARENLEFFARLEGEPEPREAAIRLLSDFDLPGEPAPSANLSVGNRQRLNLAIALLGDPEVLLLDEPTTGLDPQARHIVWDRLYRLKRQGVTLILTTHYMDEAEQLCDRLVVMDKGKIVAEGSPLELIDRYSTREVVELRFDDDRPEEFSYWTDGLVSRVESLPDRVLLYTDNGDAASHGIHERGLVPTSVLVRRSTLEDVFLHLTGRSLIE
jgi:lipooligosaccharide transport system ATP-binding protein